MFIDRIYRINHTETCNFNAPTLVTSVSHKITAKCGILCPKTLLLTKKQLHAIQFFVATRNFCPLAIPKSCAQNTSIRLLENHSLTEISGNSRKFARGGLLPPLGQLICFEGGFRRTKSPVLAQTQGYYLVCIWGGLVKFQEGGVVVKTMLCARVQICWVFVPGLTPVFQSSMSPSN